MFTATDSQSLDNSETPSESNTRRKRNTCACGRRLATKNESPAENVFDDDANEKMANRCDLGGVWGGETQRVKGGGHRRRGWMQLV
ncbi:hypothetical protein SIIN_5586_T [Serendipita indica DSM 11827]|nr:hypothetical protein SIIN_5586_T [Serendipita indica DSM 11827]